ncbi:MAG TPA: hemolysin family protein [Vicinamibacterales bacterium]|nr:hemolysin family protein [Vicinamibacterales bacterium]
MTTVFFVFLASSALLFFSVVETAFALLMRLPARLEAERENENPALAIYLEDPMKFFVPVRFLRAALLVIVVALLAQPIGTGFSQALAVVGLGVVIALVIGQILPAIIVRRSPERFLEILLPAFTFVANLLGPLTAAITGWLGQSERREQPEAPAGTPAAPTSGGSPTARPAVADESRLLRSAVDFGETLVREVMTPRPDIVAIQADATVDELRTLVREQEYSRLPVYADNLDNIVGVIVVKDLIYMTEMPAGTRKVSEFVRPASFVPETKRVADLLREFQQKRFQLSLVVDEYGGTAGLVTIEDVVEVLVGDIRDEYDLEAEPIVQESADSFVFNAKVSIGDMIDRLGIEIEEGGFETVGGYVLTRVGRVPAVGELHSFDGLAVEILEAERRRIHKVRIKKPPLALEEAGA